MTFEYSTVSRYNRRHAEAKMPQSLPSIKFDMFLRNFERFKALVERQDLIPLTSLEKSPYLQFEEGYKKKLFEEGKIVLQANKWRSEDIGAGDIATGVQRLLEMPNNLASWRMRDGIVKDIKLLLTQPGSKGLREFEEDFFCLYREENDELIFDRLRKRFGSRYPLIAYLFFSKDCTRYLPTAPTYFDTAISLLGVDFTMAYRCSWENYQTFLALIGQARILLSAQLSIDVTLLDAHSFVWTLANQIKIENPIADAESFKVLPDVMKRAVIQARIGQGKFRTNVIAHWRVCAITGCSELSLLRASHIKPWSESTPEECIDGFNGILLNGSADLSFDQGFISFNDGGQILISDKLSITDRMYLGLHPQMKLKALDEKHLPYLAYHRQRVFRGAK
jgi:hypothetical protein